MNLEEALSAHRAWNMMLQDYVYGEGDLDPDIIGADHHCDIGKWLHAEEHRMRMIPEYATARDVHARLHVCAGEIVANARDGRDDLAMDLLHQDYRAIQAELIDALTGLTEKIGTVSPAG